MRNIILEVTNVLSIFDTIAVKIIITLLIESDLIFQ